MTQTEPDHPTTTRAKVSSNRYLADNYAPVTDEVTAFDLPVIGELPADLSGRYLRNGPNPITPPDQTTHHWFVGDGMVHGIRLRDGKAEWYRNRYVGSTNVSASSAASPTSPAATGTARAGGPNTNVGGFAGTTWAMVEAGGCPVELTYELETVGRNDFFGTLPGAFTAHPKVDPDTGEMHAMVYAWAEWLDHVQYVVVARRRQGAPHGRHPAAGHDDAARHVADAALRGRVRPARAPSTSTWRSPAASRSAGTRTTAAASGCSRARASADDIVWVDAPLVLLVPPDERVRRGRRQRS